MTIWSSSTSTQSITFTTTGATFGGGGGATYIGPGWQPESGDGCPECGDAINIQIDEDGAWSCARCGWEEPE